MNPDVVVVGAGAIGTAIAFQLSKANLRVLLVDRGPIGGESTGASAGMIQLNPDRSTPAAMVTLGRESARLYPALAAELLDRTGIDIGFRKAPLLHVIFDEAEEPALRSHRGWQLEQGMAVNWLDGRSALDVEPDLNPAVRAAVYYPEQYQLLPRRLAEAQARAAADLGATVTTAATVDRLLLERERVVGVSLGGSPIRSGEVIIANGAWAGVWSAALKLPIPVRPVRGQMVSLQTARRIPRQVVSSNLGYTLSKPDGSTIVGTTVEEAGFDARPTAAGIAHLLGLAPRLVPALAGATVVTAWAGLRPATSDGLPLLGRVPGWDGILMATGHFREGILMMPITAELITDVLAGRPTRLPLDPFNPGRFLPRAA